jgi:hypothetical protein
MKIVRNIMMTILLCYGQASFSMNDPIPAPISALIADQQLWLKEQLHQINYPQLSKSDINFIVLYFGTLTRLFVNEEFVAKHQAIPIDLLQEKMSIAMQKTINVISNLHDQVVASKQEEIMGPNYKVLSSTKNVIHTNDIRAKMQDMYKQPASDFD